MFLTNVSPDLCVLTLCVMFRKNDLFLAISNENYRHYNFQVVANISGNLIFPENSQP